MCPQAPDQPTVKKSRAGLFWLQKTVNVEDEKVDGEYALIINGHSLVRELLSGVSLFLVVAESTIKFAPLCLPLSLIQKKVLLNILFLDKLSCPVRPKKVMFNSKVTMSNIFSALVWFFRVVMLCSGT